MQVQRDSFKTSDVGRSGTCNGAMGGAALAKGGNGARNDALGGAALATVQMRAADNAMEAAALATVLCEQWHL